MTRTDDLDAGPAPAVNVPTSPYDGVTYVVPCSGAKRDHPARARDLYVGSMFRHTLAAAETSARLDAEASGRPARVLILSGKYGLVELDQVLEPYDLKMGSAGSVSAAALGEQALALGIGWGAEVYALLPRKYLARLDEALRTLDVYVQDVYEGCGSIGEQRRVNANIARPVNRRADAALAGPGPVVWIGTDVQGFSWGVPILVSYGRLRAAKTMPVATAPWVLDSRAFTEVMENGGWTITAERYATDVRRYATEIGHLEWVAPQDWPAGQRVLERTGLTEQEHQSRTVASGRRLRELLAGVTRVLYVITGTTPAGYLRHLDMYRAAGIDLLTEPLVGVGALVGRPAQEAALIIKMLHAAGLRRLHGFGLKGPALRLVGDLVASVDSANWSGQARYEVGQCPHGLVEWEANCPIAAKEWAQRERAAAAAAPVQEMLPLSV